jgi:hypothetical protein
LGAGAQTRRTAIKVPCKLILSLFLASALRPTVLDPLRHPNVYMPNPLYDALAQDARFKALEAARGREPLARARKLAALVYEDDDVEGVESLLALEEKHGRRLVDDAARVLGEKNPDNPKRSLRYLIGTIKKSAEQEQGGLTR